MRALEFWVYEAVVLVLFIALVCHILPGKDQDDE